MFSSRRLAVLGLAFKSFELTVTRGARQGPDLLFSIPALLLEAGASRGRSFPALPVALPQLSVEDVPVSFRMLLASPDSKYKVSRRLLSPSRLQSVMRL